MDNRVIDKVRSLMRSGGVRVDGTRFPKQHGLFWLCRYLFAILEEMPERTYLGELELMVLIAVVRLGGDAYGVPISKELLNLAGREVALGSIYAALDRIERKGFATSLLGDPTPERGGRSKRYFRVTPAGIRAIRMTRTALANLWNGIPLLEGGRS
jgi:PadR family transcriptional regulator, regulatory protein PadR